MCNRIQLDNACQRQREGFCVSTCTGCVCAFVCDCARVSACLCDSSVYSHCICLYPWLLQKEDRKLPMCPGLSMAAPLSVASKRVRYHQVMPAGGGWLPAAARRLDIVRAARRWRSSSKGGADCQAKQESHVFEALNCFELIACLVTWLPAAAATTAVAMRREHAAQTIVDNNISICDIDLTHVVSRVGTYKKKKRHKAPS